MSWAAHNPDKYDEICRKGIARRLQRLLLERGVNMSVEPLQALVKAIQDDFDAGKVYDALLDISIEQINEEERAWAADVIDAAYERGKHEQDLS